MTATWQPSASALRNMRGMIIDRDTGWRGDPEWAPVIESAIRDGIENLEEKRFWEIQHQLWHGGYAGDYTTYGMGDKRMAKAWCRYLKRHGLQPTNP